MYVTSLVISNTTNNNTSKFFQKYFYESFLTEGTN